MRVIKQPVTAHLPAGARRVGFSHAAPSVHRLPAFCAALPADSPVVFVVGAMAHGHVDASYTDEQISVSEYPLSAAAVLARLCAALEAKMDVV